MVSYDDGANSHPSGETGFLSRVLFSTHHKTIGLQYMWLALGSVLVGMVLSALLRMHASWPEAAIPFLAGIDNAPEKYAAMRLLHGSLMVFFVLTAAPQMGFGNFLLPLQIGASEMAFPSLNRLSFWMTFASLAGMTSAFFLRADSGVNVWLASASVFCLAGLFSALNFTTTTIELRAPGMTLPRMPVTVWAWFINAILSMLIFSVLLAGCCAVLSDRLLGSEFFSSQRISGKPTAKSGEAGKSADFVAEVVLVLCASGSVRGDVAVFWIYHPPDSDVFKKAGMERAAGGAGALRSGRRGILRVGLSHVCHGDESLRAAGIRGARVVAGSSRGIFAGQLAGDVVELRECD